MAHPLDIVDALQKELIALQPIDKDKQQKIDKKFRLEFNYNSNHMEGNTLTYGETELLLILGDTRGNHSIREYDEMRNHDVAFKLIEDWAKHGEHVLTEQNIKNLNEIILVRPFWKEAITPDGQPTRRLIKIGNYKEFPNSVRLQNGEIFQYTSPIDTPIEMAELVEWYRSEERGLHPVTLATMLHYKFVRIHPFDDGNGRVARLLMNYVLLRNTFPPVIIKSDDKVNYLRALRLADVGDYEPLIAYVAEQLIWSQQIVIKAAKGESIDEPGDFDKRLKFLKKRLDDGKLEVRITKSKDAILKAWEIGILILLQKVEEKLSEFNFLFKETSQKIYITSENPFTDSPIRIADIADRLTQHDEISEILINYHFKELRKSSKLTISASISVVFYKNVYDIRTEALLQPYSKLYDDPFNEYEIQYITDSIGNFIIASIEKHLDEKKP